MAENRVIGAGNKLPWHLPEDFKWFKQQTLGKTLLMGRKTFESIGRPLPNRTNIVVSRRDNWFQEGILIVGSLKEALKFAKKIDLDVFIIGGGNIYAQTLDLADRLEVTHVKADLEADTFFPEIKPSEWELTHEECSEADEKNAYNFCFQTFIRKNAHKETGKN